MILTPCQGASAPAGAGLRHDALAERFAQRIAPRAVAAADALYFEARASVALDAPVRQLLDLNFATRAALLHAGSCYAAELEEPAAEAMISLAVGFGALFTLVDTAIAQRGITDRARCERLAAWLLGALEPERSAVAGTGMERLLSRLGASLHAQLVRMPAWPRLSSPLRALLARHAQVIVLRHVATHERAGLLRDLGAADHHAVCAHGSTGPLFALLQAALRLGSAFDRGAAERVVELHFPEFGMLHVWAEDLADTAAGARRRELNLVTLARAQGDDPAARFVQLLERYVRRLAMSRAGISALFPLCILLAECHARGGRAEGHAAHDALARGLAMLAQTTRSA